jgi:esterase/lipase
MNQRHHGFEIGDESSPHQVLWIHGYTGSPDAFAATAQKISLRLNACVSIPLLPGHGTEETHLVGHSFDDYLSAARHFAFRMAEREKPFAIIGYSFGGLLAATLAREYALSALVLALAPYTLRFPFWIPGIEYMIDMRPFWRKPLNDEDLAARKGTFYYPDFPSASLDLIRAGRSHAASALPGITCPILTLNTANDPLINPKSGQDILAKSGKNADNEWSVLPHGRHALFFPPNHEAEEDILIAFLQKQFHKDSVLNT